MVPYASELATAITNQANDARVVRDYARLLSLIKAVAVVRQARRSRDAAGRLVAAPEDYATVYALVADVYRASSSGAGAKIRAVVGAVADITATATHATVAQVPGRLALSKAAASRHVKAALKSGWLTNAETRKGYPYQLRIGEPLPPETGLPHPDALGCLAVAPNDTRAETVPPSPDEGECSTVSPLTADNSAGTSFAAVDPRDDPDIPLVSTSLYGQALAVAASVGVASVHLITTRCDCSSEEATAVLAALEAEGVVGPPNGGMARDVLIDASNERGFVSSYAARCGDERDVSNSGLPEPGEPEWKPADGGDLL